MIEKDFVQEGLRRTRIDEYLEKELERAGYGGMDVQITPLGTMVVVYAERPGMVIGRGGKNVRSITNTLKNEFGLDNPQIEVKEVSVPELNPKIMAYKIANMLQRGMHFRRVAYSNIRRIMAAGAQGVEITISGKIRGARSAVAKFDEGSIEWNVKTPQDFERKQNDAKSERTEQKKANYQVFNALRELFPNADLRKGSVTKKQKFILFAAFMSDGEYWLPRLTDFEHLLICDELQRQLAIEVYLNGTKR